MECTWVGVSSSGEREWHSLPGKSRFALAFRGKGLRALKSSVRSDRCENIDSPMTVSRFPRRSAAQRSPLTLWWTIVYRPGRASTQRCCGRLLVGVRRDGPRMACKVGAAERWLTCTGFGACAREKVDEVHMPWDTAHAGEKGHNGRAAYLRGADPRFLHHDR